MPFNATFDANKFEPRQSAGSHPVGNKFPFEITGTEVKPTKDGTGGMFVVTFTTPAGQIDYRYNLFNQSAKAVEIAHGQFSALCRAVGRYQVDFNNDGAILRGAKGCLDVNYQKGEEPTAERPEGGYVEVKKVYDVNGNEPGKPPAQTQPQGQPASGQVLQQQPSGGWGSGAGSGPQPQQTAPTASLAPAQTWQPGGQTAANPPWGSRT